MNVRHPAPPPPPQPETTQRPPLAEPERQMLRYEADPAVEIVLSAEAPTGSLVTRVRKWLGIQSREEAILEQLMRFQALFTALYQLTIQTEERCTFGEQNLGSTNEMLSSQLVPQLNRQTNAISSLLDRLQFYEKESAVLSEARRKYDKKLAEVIAARERKEQQDKAVSEGLTIAPETPAAQLDLIPGVAQGAHPNGTGPALVPDDAEAPSGNTADGA